MKTVPGGTFGLALGFFYTINVVVGTGFLGIPYAFYKGGVVVCALAMIVIAFTSVVTTLWVLETMSRAQALERRAEYDDDDEETAPQYNFVDVASESEDEPEMSDDDDESGRLLPRRRRHSSNATTPTYEIRSERKFDFPELCQRFLGPVGKYAYTTLLSVGVFLNLWTMTSIAATSWSVNVPLRRDWWPFRWPCDSESIAPEHGFHPDGNCWNNYAIFVLVFALVVTPLSMLDLKRQRFVQVGTGVMRVVVVVAIIVYCIVADVDESSLSPTPINGSTSINRSTSGEEVSWIAGDSFIDFLVALPILSYTLAIQVNVPTLSQPMEPKRKLKPFYVWLYVFLFGFYFSLGVAVLAYLKSSVTENCTLHWASLTSSVHSVSLRVLSYVVVIFPSIDVCSSYPLGVAVLSNAIHSLLGHDKPESKALESRTTRFVYRFICAVAPMIGATYVTNLSLLLRYEGLLTFILFFFFPALLHYYSTMECQKTFGPPLKGSSADVNTITYDFYGADEADGVEEQAVNVIKTPYSTFFSGLWMVPLVVVFTLLEIGGTLAGLILKKA